MKDLKEIIENMLDFYRIDENDIRQILPIEEKHLLVTIIESYIRLLYPSQKLSLSDWESLIQRVLLSIQDKKIGIEIYSFQTSNLELKEPLPKFDQNSQEIAACEDISLISVANLYTPMKIYMDQSSNLTQRIPYWVAKMLLGLKILQDTGTTYRLVDLNQLPFHYEIEEKSPIYSSCESIIEISQEESDLHEIYQYSENLTKLFDQYSFKLHDINISKAKLLTMIIENEDPTKLGYYQQLLNAFEDQEKKLTIPFLTDLKILNSHISEDRNYIKSSLKTVIDEYSSSILLKGSIFQSGKEIKSALKLEYEKQMTQFNQIVTKIDPILKEIKQNFNQIPIIANKSSLFGGKKFKLFSFDINNLHNSTKEKFRENKGIRLNIIRRIQSYVLPSVGPFKCFFFASKHLEYYRKMVPDSNYITWNIEEKIKRQDSNGFTVFCDVDTNLTAITYNFIEKYHQQIEEFILGSGDKDLIIVCELAAKYAIPVKIIVADEKNLAHELRTIAHSIYELY